MGFYLAMGVLCVQGMKQQPAWMTRRNDMRAKGEAKLQNAIQELAACFTKRGKHSAIDSKYWVAETDMDSIRKILSPLSPAEMEGLARRLDTRVGRPVRAELA